MLTRVLAAALIAAGSAVVFISVTTRVSSESSPEKRYKPELVVQTGHQGFIYDVAFSPDGKIIASGSLDATVKLWDTATGKELRTLIGHTSLVSTLAFSPDGKILASGGVDFAIRTWDVLTGKQLKVFQQHANGVTAVAFTPDGKTILSGSEDQTIRAWDVDTGNPLRTYGTEKSFDIDASGAPINRPLAIKTLAIAPDGKSVAASTKDGQIMVLDVQTFATLRSFSTEKTAVNSLAFTPDGKYLTAVSDLSINVFDAGTGAVISAPDPGYANILEKFNATREVDQDGKPINAALPIQLIRASLSRDGKLLAAAEQSIQGRNYESRLRIWKIPDGKEVKLTHSEWGPIIQSAAFAPDGATIATGGNLGSGFGVRLWNAGNGNEMRTFEGTSDEVHGLALSPDSKTIAINDTVAKAMRLIDLTGERHERSIKLAGPSWTPRFRSNDEIAFQNVDLQTYDVKSAQMVHAYPSQLPGSPFAFSADGKFLVTSELSGLTLSDAKKGTAIRTFQTEKPTNLFGSIIGLDIDPSSKIVAAASWGGQSYLFDLASGRELPSACKSDGLTSSITFSPDGKLFSVIGQTSIVMCRTEGGIVTRTISDGLMLIGVSKSVFSPDSKILAIADFTDTVRLYDVETGNELKRFPGSSSPFMVSDHCIEFSRDGRLLYSTSNRNKILIYDVANGKQLASLVTFGDSDWAVVTPDGFFDATEGAQHLMHFVVPSEQGYETISLDQLKRYYVPGLLSQIVNGSYRSRQNDFTVTLFPAVKLEQIKGNESSISAELTDRGGGIGRVEVRVNGSEVYADARNVQKVAGESGDTKLKIDIPRERFKVGSNSLEVIAWNAEGNVRSLPYTIILDLAADGLIMRGASYDSKRAAKKPSEINFYAIVSGISDYAGDGLDLRYAAKDAEDITKALSLAARKYFCANEMVENKPCTRVHIRLLSTETDKTAQFAGLPDAPDFQRLDPVKASYATAFAETAKKAGPDDVVFFYFSGHATSITSDDAVKDSGFADTYVYATRDATTLDRAVLTNRSERERTAVSSLELAAWLSEIKAQKKVLILDTCAAGAAQNDLVAQARSVDALQVRSIDRLQERTGFYVLMGSAADAVSYEANEFRQGLLTYSLLEGMTLSSTLSDGGFLDVEKWFGFSEDKVEDLAKGIGGVQRPSFFKSPTARSFDIGRIESSEVAQIPVARRVPLILQPELREEGKRTDPERLTEKLQSRLIEKSLILTRGQTAEINYVNVANAANGLSPRGSYTINGDIVTIELSLIRDEEEVVKIKVSGTRAEIVDKLARELVAAATIKK